MTQSGTYHPDGFDCEAASETDDGCLPCQEELESVEEVLEQVGALQAQLDQSMALAMVAPIDGPSSLFGQKGASPYTVLEPPVFSGPPTTVDGVTTVAGIVEIESTGTQVGHSEIDFACVVGANGTSNQCDGIVSFEGTFDGRAGGFSLALEWTAGGDAAFTNGEFRLIGGSGTGDLVDLVKWEGIFQRDEAAGLNGIISGDYRFSS